eukprot:TRINITY_DN76_c0_g1_i2.p1 TRINITY_DN76_c0_g1~~TRINITY_DN76_c0_g1_i2.p1  ORF type:complete len:564 (-),score=155.03 TRINITY_DN76_c0_g1_i2:296-1987(-)
MAVFLREKVSKNKRRYKKDGFDLDLAYITDRIIAMGFPSSSTEAVYRNPLPIVYKFFEHYHKENYKLYNLCAERKYDIEKFHSRVSQYPFYDHNAPPINLIQECCKDIDTWLKEDGNHIVGINCKAGKGRTGLIICCYMLHSGFCADTESALKYYGEKRTKDGKGVTIASQIRYIRYYEKLLKEMNGKIPEPPKLVLTKLRITCPPKISGNKYVVIEMDNEPSHQSGEFPMDKKAKGTIDLLVEGRVQGDCKIQLYNKQNGKKVKLCHFWFNTGFVDNFKLVLQKSTTDVANKDKKSKVFKDEFSIEVLFREWTDKDSIEATSNLANKEKPAKKKSAATNQEGNDDEKSNDSSFDVKEEESEEKKDETKSPKDSGKGKKSPPVESNKSKNKEPIVNVAPGEHGRARNKSFYNYEDYKALSDKGVEFSSDSEADEFDPEDGEPQDAIKNSDKSNDTETNTSVSTTTSPAPVKANDEKSEDDGKSKVNSKKDKEDKSEDDGKSKVNSKKDKEDKSEDGNDKAKVSKKDKEDKSEEDKSSKVKKDSNENSEKDPSEKDKKKKKKKN